jgi:hypothetical protein
MRIIAAGPAMLLLVVGAAAAPLAHAAEGGFVGRISLRLQDSDPAEANVTLAGDHERIDLPGGSGGMKDLRVFVDFARARVATVDDAARTWTEVPLPAPGEETDTVHIAKTGLARAVVGQRCEQWVLLGGEHRVEACVVPGVPWLDPRHLSGAAVPAWSQRLERERAFPLSVWEGSDRTVFASWATDVTRETPSGGELTVPPDYRRVPAGPRTARR